MVLIPRRPYDPGYTRDRSFKGAHIGISQCALAVSKGGDRHDENLVLGDALRAPQDEVLFMRRG